MQNSEVIYQAPPHGDLSKSNNIAHSYPRIAVPESEFLALRDPRSQEVKNDEDRSSNSSLQQSSPIVPFTGLAEIRFPSVQHVPQAPGINQMATKKLKTVTLLRKFALSLAGTCLAIFIATAIFLHWRIGQCSR